MSRRPDRCDEIHADAHWRCEGCRYHVWPDRPRECECRAPEMELCPALIDMQIEIEEDVREIAHR